MLAQIAKPRVLQAYVISGNDDQLLRVGDGQIAQHQGVEDAEDRGVGPDTECQRKDSRCRKAGASEQRTRPVANVAGACFSSAVFGRDSDEGGWRLLLDSLRPARQYGRRTPTHAEGTPMKKMSWMAALLVIGLSVAVNAQKPDADAQKVQRTTRPRSTRATPRRLRRCTRPDGTRLGPDGSWLVGRAAIEKVYADGFAGRSRAPKLTLTRGHSQVVSA